MATYASTYGNPDWYKQQINPQDAQSQANRLGISTDQLFQLYAQTNMPNIGQPGAGQPGNIPSGGLQPTQNQMAQWASGLGAGRGPGAPLPQLIAAVPSASGAAIQGMYGPMATWQNVTGGGQGNQSNQPPTWNQVGQGAGLSQSDINQFQAMGRTPVAIAQQFNVPTTQPVKQYQSGGLVTQDPSVPANIYGTQYPLYATNAQGNPTGQAIYANPTNQASLLGAAALQMPVVINPPPSGTPSAKSGVAPTGGALIGTSTPQVGWGTTGGQGGANWTALGQAAGFSPTDIAAFQRQGLTPEQVAKQFNIQAPLAGPWTDPKIGSVFTPVARTAPTMALGATPLQPAAQPTAAAYSPTATPFAQAPPAPGLQIPPTPLIAAHTDALANAGKALFAHFGGDPNSASPADIMHFHNQLTEHLAAAPQATAAKKMASGGLVTSNSKDNQIKGFLRQMFPNMSDDAISALMKNPSPITGQGGVPPPPGLAGNQQMPPGLPPGANIPAWMQAGQKMPQDWGPGPGPPTTMPPLPQLAQPPPPGLAGNQQMPPGLPPGISPGASLPAWVQAGQKMPQNWGPGPGPPTTMPPLPQLAVPPPPQKQMQSGGRVPGRGNEDTVPALLTPGEYVIPKQQVQQLMRTGRLPIKMADGGTVPDSDQNAPSEARRKTLTTPTAQSSSSSSAPAAPATPTVSGGSHLVNGLATAAQTYANSVGAGARDIRNTPLDPDPDTPYLKAAGMGGGMSKGMQSALGGIGSGLSQAAQAIASSVQPWQMQQSAIPAPPPAPAAPQFTQQQIPQQRQGSGSPYIAYATYPASPYGT